MKPSICILTPCASYYTHAKFTKCVANLISYSWRKGIEVHAMGITERMVVNWARNDLARAGLTQTDPHYNKPYTHFLWLDDDHVFNPEMLEHLLSHDVDMVSALYFQRTAPHYPVAYIKDDTPDKYKHYPLIDVPNALIQVDAVGFGACLMKREVLEAVPEPWFTLDYRAGEDIAFCVHAKENGIKIYLDGQYKLGHVGIPEIVTEKTYLKAQKDHPEIFQNKVKVKFNG